MAADPHGDAARPRPRSTGLQAAPARRRTAPGRRVREPGGGADGCLPRGQRRRRQPVRPPRRRRGAPRRRQRVHRLYRRLRDPRLCGPIGTARCGASRKRGATSARAPSGGRASPWAARRTPPVPAAPSPSPTTSSSTARGDLWVATDIAGEHVNAAEPYAAFKNSGVFRIPVDRFRPGAAIAVRVLALRGGGRRARLRARRGHVVPVRAASGRAIRHALLRLRCAARQQLALPAPGHAPAAGRRRPAPSLMRGLVLALTVAGVALDAEAARMAAPAVEYSVTAGEGARELRVEAAFADAPRGGLVFEDGMGRHVRDAEVASGREWSPATVEADILKAPACRRGCRVRYRFLLDEATRGGRNRDSAFQQGGALVAAPSVWLVRPAERAPGRYRLRVATPPGITFATGISSAGPEAYEADLADLPEAPYSAFGPFELARLRVPGAEVEVAILPGETALDRAALVAWVERAAGDVAAYYGRFPLPRALVILIPGGRRAVGFGTTMGNGGGSIMVWVGRRRARRGPPARLGAHARDGALRPAQPAPRPALDGGGPGHVRRAHRARAARPPVDGGGLEGPPAQDAAGSARTGRPGCAVAGSGRSTGAARCSGCSPTSRSASARAAASPWRTRCAACATPGAASPSRGRSSACSNAADRAVGVSVLGAALRADGALRGADRSGRLWARLGVEDAGGIRLPRRCAAGRDPAGDHRAWRCRPVNVWRLKVPPTAALRSGRAPGGTGRTDRHRPARPR